MRWESIDIINDFGTKVKAVAPVIISASRSTDIPAFYADWFFNRLAIGHSAWINPFNGVKSYVSYRNARLIVFWSKNPEPLLSRIDQLTDRNINSYIQFTLNDYEPEKLESGVSSLDHRIETFIKLSEKLGKGKVVWRFDPMLLTNTLSVDELLKRVEYIGNQIYPFNEHFVFSFIDIGIYKKVALNLVKADSGVREFSFSEKLDFANGLRDLNRKWGFSIGTCAEQIDLDSFDIHHNKCIDERLIIKYFSHDKKLMDFLGVKYQMPDIFGNSLQTLINNPIKDKGQREFCGCIVSKDIGQYDTCPHLCEYCYANSSKERAQRNYRCHLANPFSETITGL